MRHQYQNAATADGVLTTVDIMKTLVWCAETKVK